MENKKDKNKEKPKQSDQLTQFYSTFSWPHDPKSELGEEYFKMALSFMESLIEHTWIKKLISKKRKIKILEICGGSGFGGIALSRAFAKKKVNWHLLITDLRKDSLDLAQRWAEDYLKKKVEVLVVDARETWKLKEKFDVCLIYGLSTPHFNPWDLVKLLSSVGEVLTDDGILVVDEADRRFRIFLEQGYKWALAEELDPDKFVVSFHTGYDFNRGTCKKAYVNFNDPKKPVRMEVFMWGLAEVGAFLWTFFKDVDFISLGGTRHFILGYQPRRLIKPGDLKKPSVKGYLFS
ncbi:MAG: hypothetical protein AMJ90_06220 [candidate division Zixibacteria bacterium SM23_73_2]|nr:MAG: hypothetical protein AMJ90_06220 [candidate division Zixibacteria bacterium SM23_73_2]